MIDPNEIKGLIVSAIPGAEVSVRDLTGDGDHFEVTVVSDSFEGKGLIEQHQMVYGALRGEMADRIHALSIKAHTFKHWQQGPKPRPDVS